MRVSALDLVIGLIWVIFWVYWFIAAAAVKATRPGPQPYRGIGIRLIAALVVIVLLRTNVIRNIGAAAYPVVLQWIGCALFLLGLAFAVWARLYLGTNWGFPMSEKTDPELVTTGPYRWVRHPIYSGIILAMLGTALAVGVDWLVVAVLLGAYFIYSATVEERTMARLFPTTYPNYRRSTRMLIPFVL